MYIYRDKSPLKIHITAIGEAKNNIHIVVSDALLLNQSRLYIRSTVSQRPKNIPPQVMKEIQKYVIVHMSVSSIAIPVVVRLKTAFALVAMKVVPECVDLVFFS